MSFWDEGYTILSETRTDKEITTVARTDGGATIVCHEPIHTPEEEERILSNFALACAKMMYPDKDLSNVGSIRLICNENL
ncbi:MAG: hypothetical protein NC253_12635 [Ruminococcus sp.]|nr:hypothetical protein [Ruminococcus sp.]MCM1382803.1 hypothetical protein [Muribaculaceae bacterium]